MALAERRDCKDHISILACKSWNLLKVIIFAINLLRSDIFYKNCLNNVYPQLDIILCVHFTI